MLCNPTSHWKEAQDKWVDELYILPSLLDLYELSVMNNFIIPGEEGDDFYYTCENKGAYFRLERYPETFSYYTKGGITKYPTATYRLDNFIEDIRTRWRREIEEYLECIDDAKNVELLSNLPAITISAEIINSDHTRKSLTDGKFRHSNLIYCDFAWVTEPDEVDELLEKLKQDEHVRCAFKSPTKTANAFIKVAKCEGLADHESAFDAVETYCEHRFEEDIDIPARSIGELCFVSYDPDALIKSAEELPWFNEHSSDISRIWRPSDQEKIKS